MLIDTMNKIAIVGDTHFGASNSSITLHDYMEKFYRDFFQYIDDNDIKTIIQLGDLFDVRKHINTWSLNFFREVFLKPVIERNLRVVVLLGNHDIYYRESLQISSVEEVLTPYQEWFTLIKEPTDIVLYDKSFLMVPWVCKENHDRVSQSIKESESQYCCGHFEFNGFEMFSGHMSSTTYDHLEYKKFRKVFSGHYHHMSSKDNIIYTGTPYELTWQDCNTSKGFYVMEGDAIAFIENRHRFYSSFALSQYDKIPESLVTEKNVRILVDTDLTPKQREKLLDSLHRMKPHSIKLIEKKIDVESVDIEYQQGSSISDLISDYVDVIPITGTVDRDKLKNVLIGMFVEASNAN